MSCGRSVYAFSAIVGQERMKKALLLNAINPKIGGVLIRGEKGTAKSTAVRALANLLPQIEVVANCPFACDPKDPALMCSDCLEAHERGDILPLEMRKVKVVTLPVGATEDRVVGTLDLEHAIKKGSKRFEPGVLAEVNRGILYVDEVNLLEDHIVDVLLDSAAMGMNIVEREGISFSHPSHFILVGTMNPEEGNLRPQLLDRFGLCVDIQGIFDRAQRMEVARRRLAYEEAPFAFADAFASQEEALRNRIGQAQELLPQVDLPDALMEMIVGISIDMAVDGHRSDIVMAKTAATLAAWEGRKTVTEEDVKEAAALVLPHRMRRRPFEEERLSEEKIQESIDKTKREQPPPPPQGSSPESPPPTDPELPSGAPPPAEEKEQVFEASDPYAVKEILLPRDRRSRLGGGRRVSSRTERKAGRYVKSCLPKGECQDLALDATLRAAAPHQRERSGECAVIVEDPDIREKIRERKVGTTVLFVVDASGSMAAKRRMSEAKAAILSLLMDAYQKRDRVGMVAFKGKEARVILPPTASVELAKRRLEVLPTGGRTPLSRAFQVAYELLEQERKKDPDMYPLMVVVSDGRPNVSLTGKDPLEETLEIAYQVKQSGIASLFLDVEQDFLRLGLGSQIAAAMGGKYFRLEDLRSESILNILRQEGVAH
ncbi:MAG: putative cobaltochelatase [candidate division NC10 bacterium]|nr:putative cobaltochelatase [candidate division NC10 bacterium]